MLTHINVSAGTAATLGLTSLAMDVPPTTAYLMLGGRCTMNCGFCAQARESHASALNLSRITWPSYPLDQVASRLATAFQSGTLKRACLQVTVTRRAQELALEVVRVLRAASIIPIDVAILPRSLEGIRTLLEAGVEHIGFGLDAACRRIFEQVKTGNWERNINLIRQAALTFPGHVAVHLIVGLGETEREMIETIQQMHDWDITVGLFAFTPVRGTKLGNSPPPPLSQYRRIQAARFLIGAGLARLNNFDFDHSGRLIAIQIAGWPAFLANGHAFETSGCPDCNRPYYNERPGGVMYNYPRRLTQKEVEQAIRDMQIDLLLTGG